MPTGNDGFPHRAHCPFREINKKKIEIRYFNLILDFNSMKLVLYGLHQPKKYKRKTSILGHTVYDQGDSEMIVPEEFSGASINPQSFIGLKKEFNIGSITILDRLKPDNGPVCVLDHVNQSGYNFLMGQTPTSEFPTFPDMSNIYNQIKNLEGVVVYTVGPDLFSGVGPSSFIASESVGLISPVWHYIGVRVFAKNDYLEKLR